MRVRRNAKLTVRFVPQVGYSGVHTKWKLAPDNWQEPLFAFPVTSIAYLCHFNVLPVHEELAQPTRKRLKGVIHGTMGFCWLFYTTVALLGYFYAFDPEAEKCDPESCHGVRDVILRNFDNSDIAINIGRVGLSTTLAASYPLLVVPCRNTLLGLMRGAGCCSSRRAGASDESIAGQSGGRASLNNR